MQVEYDTLEDIMIEKKSMEEDLFRCMQLIEGSTVVFEHPYR
ncbi:hypothetical protein [Bacillus massiliglaciei]|nr:hypothetical protein [Bacillus massiliglaciei]